MTISFADYISLLLAVIGTLIGIVVPVARAHFIQMTSIRTAITEGQRDMSEFKTNVAENYCKKQDLEKFAEQIDKNMEKRFQHLSELIELKIQRTK